MMVRKSIPPGIDPPSSLLPRRLDKPVYSVASHTYADILKKQFSLAPTPAMTTTDNNRPPRKRSATILEYASTQSADYPPLATTTANNITSIMCNQPPQSIPTTTTPTDCAKDILSIKTEIQQLKDIIAQAVEQIKNAIAAIHAPPSNSTPMVMDTDDVPALRPDHSTATPNLTPNQLDIPAIINELKTEIATITNETRAMFQQLLPQPNTKPQTTSMT